MEWDIETTQYCDTIYAALPFLREKNVYSFDVAGGNKAVLMIVVIVKILKMFRDVLFPGRDASSLIAFHFVCTPYFHNTYLLIREGDK